MKARRSERCRDSKVYCYVSCCCCNYRWDPKHSDLYVTEAALGALGVLSVLPPNR